MRSYDIKDLIFNQVLYHYSYISVEINLLIQTYFCEYIIERIKIIAYRFIYIYINNTLILFLLDKSLKIYHFIVIYI